MTDKDQCDEFANAYRDHARNAFVDRMFKKIPVSGSVVDLGCGPGDFLIDICDKNSTVNITGVDGSSAMIEYANSLIQKNNLQSRIVTKNMLFEDIDQGEFDITISSLTLHHQADPLLFWDTIRRITKNNGHIFVMDLIRPQQESDADNLVKINSGSEKSLFQQDYKNSLLAAFTVSEIQQQLNNSDLAHLTVETEETGQLVFVYGKY